VHSPISHGSQHGWNGTPRHLSRNNNLKAKKAASGLDGGDSSPLLGQFVHKVPSHAAKEEDHQFSCTIFFFSVILRQYAAYQAVATSHLTTSCDTIGH